MRPAEAYALFILSVRSADEGCPVNLRSRESSDAGPLGCSAAKSAKSANSKAFRGGSSGELRFMCHELRLLGCDANFPSMSACGTRLVVRVTLIVPVRRAG